MSPRYPNVTASTRELIIRYVSNNFRFIMLNPHKELQGDPKVSIGEMIIKTCINPLCIDYPKVTSGICKLSAITYIK